MYKVINDTASHIFLEPIPRWITHIGFGVMVLLFMAISVSTAFFKYPQEIAMAVVINKEESFMETDLETYEIIAQIEEPISIRIPSMLEPVQAELLFDQLFLKQDGIAIPLKFANNEHLSVKFDNSYRTTGTLLISNETLLEKIIGTIF